VYTVRAEQESTSRCSPEQTFSKRSRQRGCYFRKSRLLSGGEAIGAITSRIGSWVGNEWSGHGVIRGSETDQPSVIPLLVVT